ncbi:hypothetical protein CN918_26495 [Priestia megaterium]|nr:hypothetical protein CN918_26495 [Priestia megaterium]
MPMIEGRKFIRGCAKLNNREEAIAIIERSGPWCYYALLNENKELGVITETRSVKFVKGIDKKKYEEQQIDYAKILKKLEDFAESV